MSLKELFELLPKIIELFVPGYICMVIYKYFVDTETKDFNVTAVSSIVLSYVFQLIATFICNLFSMEEPGLIKSLLAIIFSVSCAVAIVYLRSRGYFKTIFEKIGKVSGNTNIWYDFFDVNRGTRVRFFCKYGDDLVEVRGDVCSFEVIQDKDCRFMINNIKIIFMSGEVYEPQNKEYTMIFYVNEVTGLEAHYGKEKKSNPK